MSVTTDIPTENNPEYIGPQIHLQIHSQVSQPTAQYPYQDLQSGMPLAHPGAPYATVPPFAYHGAPYSPYGVQPSQIVSAMYLAQMFPQSALQAVQFPNSQSYM